MLSKYHTIGRRNMSMLEKVVYIADRIEAGRKHEGVEKIRELAYNGDIDCAILLETEDKIRYLLTTGRVIHTNTLEMRNSIMLKSCKKREVENEKKNSFYMYVDFSYVEWL